jgi:hypothetical protein
MYNLDEFRTSKLHYKTEEECENLYLPDKKNKMRKIHAVLTCKMENNRMECINRDENAVNNMIKIVKSHIKGEGRPEKYKRTIKNGNLKTHCVEGQVPLVPQGAFIGVKQK